jgi:hypothetical protein
VIPPDEAEAVFGRPDVVVEPLGHATPAATAGVWRVSTADDRAVLKVVHHDPGGNERWPSSDVESSPYYWRREPAAYASGLLESIDPLRAPRCRLCRERPHGTVALWLEDVGDHPAWTEERLRGIAYDLGSMQGRLAAALPEEPWLSRGWLRAYLELRARWIEGYRDGPFAAEVERIWSRRAEILERVDASRQTFCHFDFYPANIFGEQDTVVIDWAYCGLGAVGLDAGNLIPDAIFDGFVALEDADAARDAVWAGYVGGLRDAGFAPDTVELLWVFLAATALKYAWIPGTAVARGPDDEIGRRWLEIFPLIVSWAEESIELE